MSKPSKQSGLGVLLPILRLLRPYKARATVAAIALCFTAAATLGLGFGVQTLIDVGFASDSIAGLQQAMLTLLAIASAIAAGTFTRFYFVSWLGERISADLRAEVFNNLVNLHPSFFEENRPGEIMSRLTTDTTLLQTIIGSSLSMALRSMLTLSGAVIMMFATNWKLSLFIVVGVPAILVPILFFGRKIRKLSSASQDSMAQVGTYAGEVIHQLKTVQAFNRQAFEQGMFKGEVESAFDVAKQRIRNRALLIGVAIFVVFASMIGMLYSGGSDVINGVMTAGELGAFIFYAVMLGSGFATVSEVWGEVQRAAGAAERLIELMNAESELIEPHESPELGTQEAAIEFKDVSFAYPSRPNRWALEGFNLRINAGESVALVGPSGAGKSTIFELIQRFYDPQQGEIQFGTTAIKQTSLMELRAQIAVVPQQPVLFSTTVRNNIAYGQPKCTSDQIEQAARAAHAHDFIEQLPDQYDAYLGEQGVRLSGGQKQRIAIARAILKDPRVLLLDEATSALDTESEHHIQTALAELVQDRTTVIIAHRLSTILHVDRIVVVDRGKIVAQGTHHELLKTSPLYKRLAELQFNERAHARSQEMA
jgi:ATP-binding cassette subfamily B protein